MGLFKLVLGIGIPLLLIGGPIGFAYGFCYDNSPSEFTPDKNFDSETITSNIIVNSLQTTKDDNLIRVGVSEDNLNNLLHVAFSQLDPTLLKFVESPYIKVDEEQKSVEFILKAHVPMFATSLHINTSFEFVKANENHPDGVLFKINEIKIGRLKALSLGISIAQALISDETLQDLFKQAGLSMIVSLKDRSLFYSSDDLINDVIKKAGIDNIYLSMVEFALENEMLGVSINKENLGLNLDLSKLTSNEMYVSDSKSVHVEDQMLGYFSDIEKLLNAGKITFNDIDNAIDFLRFGYQNCTPDVQTLMSETDLSSIGILNASEHKGLNIVASEDITDVFNKQLNSLDPLKIINDKKIDIIFDEDDLNETLKTSQIIGQSYQFNSVIDGSAQVNAIFIDDFYVNIMNNELDFVIGVNFNGCSTKLIIKSAVQQYEGNVVKLDITDILFGELQANAQIKKACIDFVMDALTNLTTWFRADGAGKLIFFDLNECVKQVSDPTIKTFLSGCTLNSNVIGEKLDDNGQLKITFSK